jgi:hypothetical protein
MAAMPDSRDRSGRPRPGRPYGSTRADDGAVTSSRRVAWLLRANRLLGGDPAWARASAFVAAFPGGCHPDRVSVSTVSRWETAMLRAPFLAVRRYEELLELPPGLLASTADLVHRFAAPAASGPPILDRAGPHLEGTAAHARLDALLERALSSDVMHGEHWDELTGHLSAKPSIVIFPSRLWTELASRLLDETIIADGLPWLQRFEAINRLLGHPVGGVPAVAVCASLAADPDGQVPIEPISLLDANRDADASRHVLGHLRNPTNEQTRYGALLACVRKVRYGHFTPVQLQALVPVVAGMMLDSAVHEEAVPLAVEVLRKLPPELRSRADAELRRAMANDRILREVHAAGRLAESTAAGRVVDRVTLTAQVGLGRPAPAFAHDLLPTLIDEILFAPVFDNRLYASLLVRATPYRQPVAAAIAGELAKPQVVGDMTLAGSMLGALRVLGGPQQRPLMERLVLAAGLPPAVPAAAARHIGHVGGLSTDAFWLTAIAMHGRSWRRHREKHSALALHGLVYALGMARNQRILTRIREDQEAPPPVRAAARWWLDRPHRIAASALC